MSNYSNLSKDCELIARWMYSNLSTNIPLYCKLCNETLPSLLFYPDGHEWKIDVKISVIANNSLSVYDNSVFSNKISKDLFYFRDPSFVDKHKLQGDYISVSSNRLLSLLTNIGDKKPIVDIKVLNYSWVISQSRDYKLDTLLKA